MNTAQVRELEAFERAMYRDFYAAAPPSVVKELGLVAKERRYGLLLSSSAENHPFFNRVMLADQPTVDELRGIDAHYSSIGVTRWMLQVPPNLEPLRRDLADRPIVDLRGWAKHLYRHKTAPPGSITDEGEPQVQLGSGSEARVWAAIVTEAFDFPALCVDWLAELVERPAWTLYLATVDAQPAATGALFIDDDKAALNFGATLPDVRRRGAQSALIRRRLADALDARITTIVSETDEELPDKPNPSTRNLIRHGLDIVYVRRNLGPPPPASR